jgi:hypothetical protein
MIAEAATAYYDKTHESYRATATISSILLRGP